jgi:hypothetical protein
VKGDLEGLIEGVEGNWWPDKSDVQSFSRHCEGAIPDDVRALWVDAWGAYHGSLDAALRLHEALLPGWDYHLWNLGRDEAGADVAHHEHGQQQDSAISSNQARAWLLAILRALAKREEG